MSEPVVGESGPAPPAAGPAGLRRVPLVNVANGLTVLRIGLIPVFVALMIAGQMTRPGWRMAAGITFVAASLTDFADGRIARAFGLVTSFGKVADPIADKALTGTALVLLSWYGALPWWVTAVILTREIGVTLLRFWVIRHGVIPASRGGKAKTALQILAIAWYICPFPAWAAAIGPWLMAIATVVTVATGVDYVTRALQVRRGARAEG
ncbi:MAG: CDP-diacylglycerol--glycerol-3-phosphate 3-phosphatidyltransferase [Micromonosporaceae bacterium]